MEAVKFVDSQKMSTSIETFVNLMGVMGALYDYKEAFSSKERREATWGLAGSIVAVLRNSISLSYAGSERTEGIPANEAGYWMASALDNVATPFITIAKSCDGVSIETEELPKCFSTMAQEVGKQALRTTIAIMGNVQMIRAISDMNESLVTAAVLKEFLLAGAANHKAVYDKYGISYGNRSTFRSKTIMEYIQFGFLIKAIGKKEFGAEGMSFYTPALFWVVNKQAFSIEDVRSSVDYYYSRIVNETPVSFNSPDIFLFSSNDVRGEAAITVEFNAADIRVKRSSLVCFNEDSDHPSENPLKHLLYFGDTPTREFTLKFARTSSSWLRCNLYSATGIYLGSKSMPINIEGYDNDGDEMLDQWEIDKGFDPNNPADATEDKDNDGLTNLEEFQHNTNPKESDSDGDNFTDKQELDAGTDPLDGTKYPSTLTAPKNIRATSGDGSVTLSWDAVPNAESYRICLAGQHSGSEGTIKVCRPNVPWGDYSNWWDAVSSTTATLKTLPDGSTPLVNGTTYTFQVLAQAADGSKSPFSSEVSATPDEGVPSVVPSLKIRFDQASLDELGADFYGMHELINGRDGGAAVKFYGVNNRGHIRIPNRPEMKFTDAATFDMWVRIDSRIGMDGWGRTTEPSSMSLLAKSHDRDGVAMLTSMTPSIVNSWFQTFDQSWSNSNCQMVKDGSNVPLNTWFRITMVASSTEGTANYINKELMYTCPNARPSFARSNQQDLYIGKFRDYWYPLDGAMQDVNIYQQALTTEQVQALP